MSFKPSNPLTVALPDGQFSQTDTAPASTFVAVTALNDPAWLLEVELIAAL
jgi:enamine deaminase RidA (YjgF/YER057c/UK114 family)